MVVGLLMPNQTDYVVIIHALARIGAVLLPLNTRLTAEEIEFLVEKGDPLDKAGAYAVQAQAALFIEGIEGDYWNVVGLPVNLVYELVRDLTAN